MVIRNSHSELPSVHHIWIYSLPFFEQISSIRMSNGHYFTPFVQAFFLNWFRISLPLQYILNWISLIESADKSLCFYFKITAFSDFRQVRGNPLRWTFVECTPLTALISNWCREPEFVLRRRSYQLKKFQRDWPIYGDFVARSFVRIIEKIKTDLKIWLKRF